jgi:uncharacterized membrane-anchored protein YitT (DUF2179 family)
MLRLFLHSQKLFAGCTIVGLGLILLHHSHLVTGGTAGLSLSLSYLFGVSFPVVFLLVNLPFYVFSLINMGGKFTVSTISAVTLLSGITYIDHFLPHFAIPAIIGAVFGGIVIGAGLVLLFLSGSSLGGATILAVSCQKKYGWDPGKVNFSFDFVVVCTSIFSVGIVNALYSFLSILILGLVISLAKNRIRLQIMKGNEKSAA